MHLVDSFRCLGLTKHWAIDPPVNFVATSYPGPFFHSFPHTICRGSNYTATGVMDNENFVVLGDSKGCWDMTIVHRASSLTSSLANYSTLFRYHVAYHRPAWPGLSGRNIEMLWYTRVSGWQLALDFKFFWLRHGFWIEQSEKHVGSAWRRPHCCESKAVAVLHYCDYIWRPGKHGNNQKTSFCFNSLWWMTQSAADQTWWRKKHHDDIKSLQRFIHSHFGFEFTTSIGNVTSKFA